MRASSLVGSAAVRVATAIFALVFLWLALLYTSDALPAWPRVLRVSMIASGLLTFMAFVHTSKALYAGWLRVAEAIHTVVITVLFGLIYLVVVPLFALVIWPFDVLRVRQSQAGRSSFWIDKRPTTVDRAFLRRMG